MRRGRCPRIWAVRPAGGREAPRVRAASGPQDLEPALHRGNLRLLARDDLLCQVPHEESRPGDISVFVSGEHAGESPILLGGICEQRKCPL